MCSTLLGFFHCQSKCVRSTPSCGVFPKHTFSMLYPAGMGTQWKGMGLSLMKLDLFRQSILRSDEALKSTGLKVSDLLLCADENTFDDTVHAFVGLAAIQVRLK